MRILPYISTFILFFCGVYFAVFIVQLWVDFDESSSQYVAITKNDTHALIEILNEKVKLFCALIGYPKDKWKWKHIAKLWGKKCSKLVVMTSNSKNYKDEDFDVVEVYAGVDGKTNLWRKTRIGFNYTYEKYYNEYDWFLKTDTDTFLVVENFKYLLYQYDPNISYIFGHRYISDKGQVRNGYMAGMGYVLSKEALRRFYIRHSLKKCPQGETNDEDLFLGKCLEEYAIQVDTRDKQNLHTLFPVGIESAINPWANRWWWYSANQFYPINHGTNCCSSTPLGFHRINLNHFYMLNYLFYHVHPFGIYPEHNETLPIKLDFKDVIIRSLGVKL